VWGLEGPDRLRVDELADLIAGERLRKHHLQPGTLRARWLPRRLHRRADASADEVFAAESLADAPDAAAEFGVPRTPLREGLRRSGPAG
jgi:hypothetical protein